LHLRPGVLEVPVGVVLLKIIGVGGRRPVLSPRQCLVQSESIP
jgi:hypothetical protein